jgi:hypothetical protein
MHRRITAGFAILGQKQYPSAAVHYWAAVRAEVFQCSFLFLSSSLVFQLGSGSGQTIFKFPNIAKPYRWLLYFSERLLMETDYKHIPKTDKQLSN